MIKIDLGLIEPTLFIMLDHTQKVINIAIVPKYFFCIVLVSHYYGVLRIISCDLFNTDFFQILEELIH